MRLHLSITVYLRLFVFVCSFAPIYLLFASGYLYASVYCIYLRLSVGNHSACLSVACLSVASLSVASLSVCVSVTTRLNLSVRLPTPWGGTR